MSDGSEFQVCGAATENDRRANSVRVLAADSVGASEDRRCRTGTADWIRSFWYAGVDDERTLNVNVAMEGRIAVLGSGFVIASGERK